jgi:hypothetical protein
MTATAFRLRPPPPKKSITRFFFILLSIACAIIRSLDISSTIDGCFRACLEIGTSLVSLLFKSFGFVHMYLVCYSLVLMVKDFFVVRSETAIMLDIWTGHVMTIRDLLLV